MSQEIVDAVRALGQEKGIAEDKLIAALEDAHGVDDLLRHAQSPRRFDR